MKTSRSIVAIILAITVMGVLFLNTTTMRDPAWVYDETQKPILDFWKDILFTIIGALAGYIAGSNKND